MIKSINQNPERYSLKQDRYQISATSSIKPLDLLIGATPQGLLPLLEVDGIIVEVGQHKLVSQATLDSIKESNNPHYDIKSNGEVKGVKIGQTIPHITVNINNLTQSAAERDVLNLNGAVVGVDYIFNGETVPDTDLSINLVKQINYTLNPSASRPEDTYTVVDLVEGSDEVYSIVPFNALNAQDLTNNIFSYTKLSNYLDLVKEKQILLQKDFNNVKSVFYESKIPTGLKTYKVTKMATAEDVKVAGDVQIVYKSAQPILAVVASPPPNSEDNSGLPPIPQSKVQIWAVSGKSVVPVKVYEKEGNQGRLLQKYGAGARFLGEYLNKSFEGKRVYKVVGADNTTVIGYVADNRVVTGE